MRTPGIKHKKARWIVLLCIVLSIFTARVLLNHAAQARMLHSVDLDGAAGLQQVDYTFWQDPLQYVDGYEIMAFAVDEASWNPPDSWRREPSPVSIDAIAADLGVTLNTDAILNLSLGGERCGAWYFTDHRSGRPFDQQEFCFAYCDETYPGGLILFIYRGHHLYSF